MTTPNKHSELIEAWRNGAEIEYLTDYNDEWADTGPNPRWYEHRHYRIKQANEPLTFLVNSV